VKLGNFLWKGKEKGKFNARSEVRGQIAEVNREFLLLQSDL
jgi:hypothetical protein